MVISQIKNANFQRGFTLVEMVAVIVLLGILAVGSTRFIADAVQIFQDTTRRDTLAQQGRFVVERISRELRNALPGSIRVSGDCLEFSPIEAASSYLGNVADTHKTSFQSVDFDYTSTAVSNRRVAIYTIENKDVYIYNRKAVVDLDRVDTASANQRQVHLKNYTNPGHKFRRESPQQRFYIVTRPVSFCLRSGALYRHSEYGWNNPQSTALADIGAGLLLANHIQLIDGADTVIPFRFSAGTSQRSAVTQLDLRFNDTSEPDEWVRFSQEVFVRNTP